MPYCLELEVLRLVPDFHDLSVLKWEARREIGTWPFAFLSEIVSGTYLTRL